MSALVADRIRWERQAMPSPFHLGQPAEPDPRAPGDSGGAPAKRPRNGLAEQEAVDARREPKPPRRQRDSFLLALLRALSTWSS
jgi:hypothetical protein